MRRMCWLGILSLCGALSCARQEVRRPASEETSTTKERENRDKISEQLQSVAVQSDEQLFTLHAQQFSESTHPGTWNYGSYLGQHYVALYSLMLDWLGETKQSKLRSSQLREEILSSQMPNGSWYAVFDANLQKPPADPGDLNATLINYWFLKSTGLSPKNDAMVRARAYVLQRGGLESSSMFSKVFLALFFAGAWDEVPRIPFFAVDEKGSINTQSFGQWIGPHLAPMAYLKSLQAYRDFDPAKYRIDELALNPERWGRFRKRQAETTGKRSQPGPPTAGGHGSSMPGPSVWVDAISTDFRSYQKLLQGISGKQRKRGSWGGYTLATMLSMATLDDFVRRVSAKPALAARAGTWSRLFPKQVKLGLKFCDELYLQKGLEGNAKGLTQDGKVWDTALAGLAALASPNVTPDSRKALHAAARALIQYRHPAGGFPFGDDFQAEPDTDDTAEVLLFLNELDRESYSVDIDLGVKWLLSMQNRDGGWGAFSRDNDGNFFTRMATKSFQSSADIFDESSPDVVGHILEAFGKIKGWDATHPTVKRALRYLRDSFDERVGGWSGRWGVNYIYGTSAAVVGALAVGLSPEDPQIQQAVEFLEGSQNADGGFGESTASYVDPRWAGRGVSTASQTAWAMLPLIAVGRMQTSVGKRKLERAADFLLANFRVNGRFKDASVVGTGHPGVVYMEYSAYPRVWPPQALGQFRKARR